MGLVYRQQRFPFETCVRAVLYPLVSRVTMRSTFFAYDHIPVGLALWTLLVAVVVQPTTALDWNATKAVIFADDTWNCAGNAPPCHDCVNRVPAGSSQDPYGCAPYVAHCLAAGGAVGLSRCGSIDEYSTYEHNGVTYDLNYVAKQDKSCGGLCLLDYLKAIGWRRATTVRAGTVCAVVGEDNGQPVP